MDPQLPVAFVSDEHYAAIVGAEVEFARDGKCLAIARSSASGTIYVDLPAGDYQVTLAKEGFGSKRTIVTLDRTAPWQFRLLSDAMCGYAWPKWARSGESSEFRVHSPRAAYHLSLWRYGREKELIKPIGWFDEHASRANQQILPDGDFTITGVGWNQTGYNPNAFRVVAPERSGLYYFHAETMSGEFLSFPWVVAPAKPRAKIAVIASTNTWNAYNNYGGRSNYINPTRLPPTPTVNARQDLSRYTHREITVWHDRDNAYQPLSFDRPEPFNHIPKQTKLTDPIRGRQACHLAEAEWKLLGWLEREGFAYDLYSDYQLDAGVLDLDAYECLVLSTHPEYWSRRAYERVKQWVFERGGRLLYLGGNGIDCEIEFTGDSAMRCKTWLGTPAGVPMRDPETGAVYDCRFHRTVESPAKLLGVVFSEAGAMTGAPYRVIDPSHWVFEGTGVKEGDVFGAASLHERCPGGASGHETDKRTASSPSNCQVMARGTNPNDGGAEMIFFEAPNGGAVFSVGSINWPSSILVDPIVSATTRNVLKRLWK